MAILASAAGGGFGPTQHTPSMPCAGVAALRHKARNVSSSSRLFTQPNLHSLHPGQLPFLVSLVLTVVVELAQEKEKGS